MLRREKASFHWLINEEILHSYDGHFPSEDDFGRPHIPRTIPFRYHVIEYETELSRKCVVEYVIAREEESYTNSRISYTCILFICYLEIFNIQASKKNKNTWEWSEINIAVF